MTIPYYPQPSIPIGSHSIAAFAITAVLAVCVSLWAILRRSSRLGVPIEEMLRLWFVMYVSAIAGAHLFKVVIDQNSLFLNDPSRIFHYQGLSSVGAFGGGLFSGLIFSRRFQRISWLEILRRIDIMAYVMPLAFMIGRLGCALAHDHKGRPSTSWLAVDFPTGPRFDLGVLEFLFFAVVAILFWLMDRQARPMGFYAAVFAVLYGGFRLISNSARMETDYFYGASSIMIGLATFSAMRWYRKRSGVPDSSPVASH